MTLPKATEAIKGSGQGLELVHISRVFKSSPKHIPRIFGGLVIISIFDWRHSAVNS
jgi:hypothetical protein